MYKDDSSTDDQSRKRQSEDQELSRRSKKTFKSPPKTSLEMNDKLDVIMNMIQEMKKDLTSEMGKIGENQEECTKEVRKIKKENNELKIENTKMKGEITTTKNQLEGLEKRKRKNNTVLSGLETNTTDTFELKEVVDNFIRRQLGIEVKVKTVYKIREEVYVIELQNEHDKLRIMQNKSKLKNLPNDKIYNNHDLTKTEREIQKGIRLRAKEERNRGKTVKYSYNKLVIEGVVWIWNKSTERTPKKILEKELGGRKRRGRPKHRWKKEVEEDRKELNVKN